MTSSCVLRTLYFINLVGHGLEMTRLVSILMINQTASTPKMQSVSIEDTSIYFYC